MFEEIKLYSLNGDIHDLNSKLKKVCVLLILNFQNFNNMDIYDRNNLYLKFGHLDVFNLSHRVCSHIFLSKEIEPELHKSVLYFHFNLLSENVPCIPMRVKTLG